MNILVTGTNRGIGLELTRQLVASGNNVFATCRTPSADLEKTKATIIPDISMENDTVITNLKNCKILPQKLDGVICNAGCLSRESLQDLSCTETLSDQFQVNSLGPLRVFKGLENRLDSGSKFVVISSILASIELNQFEEGNRHMQGGYYGYRMSKAAANMAMASLAVDVRDRNISVGMIHPGYVKTDMTEGRGDIEKMESAKGVIDRFNELNIETSGTFLRWNGEKLPW